MRRILRLIGWTSLALALGAGVFGSIAASATGLGGPGLKGGGNCSGGACLGSNGTAAAPTFSFGSDPDNGLYLSGTNEVSIATAGAQRASFSSAGVGVNAGDLYLGSGVTAARVISSGNTSNPIALVPGTAATKSASFRTGSNVEVAFVGVGGVYASVPQSVTTGGAYTLTPTSGYVRLDPASNATVTMGETGVLDGSEVCITNIHATSTADFADTAGVSELAGAFTMGQYDSLCLLYVSDRWVETSRSNN